MFEKRLYYHIDWAMLAAILALCVIGVVQIYSATASSGQTLYVTQIYGIMLGLVAMVVCLTLDYRSLADKSLFLYLAVVGLLVFVLFFGVVRGGSRRWIDLGPLNLQPSEFAKATVALVLAKFLGDSRRGAIMRGDLLIAGAITAVPFLIIARQPDLGTAVTLLALPRVRHQDLRSFLVLTGKAAENRGQGKAEEEARGAHAGFRGKKKRVSRTFRAGVSRSKKSVTTLSGRRKL